MKINSFKLLCQLVLLTLDKVKKFIMTGPQCELVFCKLIVLSCINKGHYYYYDNVFVSSSSINFQSKLLSWYACFFRVQQRFDLHIHV